MWGEGPRGRAVPLWGAAWQNKPLTCSRIRVISRAEVPEASQSDGSTEWWSPRLGDGEGREDWGQQGLSGQVARAWPQLYHWLPE